MKVVAIDPGGNTGIVSIEIDEASVQDVISNQSLSSHALVQHANVEGKLELFDVDCRDVMKGFSQMNTLLHSVEPDIIVYETFDLWTVAADLTPVELIALMKWEWRNWANLVQQNPSERSVITDKRLKDWGLWYPGRKDVNAAMKHLLVWIRKNQA
jgi:hypothetical protein